MDVKNSNLVTIVVGIVFILIGLMNIINSTSWWHYITFVCGIGITCFGIYGYKTGRKY